MDIKKHARALELDKILAMCAEHAVSEEAKQRILEILPEPTFIDAQNQLDLTSDAHSLTNRFGNPGLFSVRPCKDMVAKARIGAVLSMQELLYIAALLRASRMLITWRRQAESDVTALDSLFEALTPNQALEENIRDCILSEDEIADDASPQLSDIRRKIKNSNAKARESLDKIVKSSSYSKYLQEQIVTIRNGRFVVPLRAEHRSELKGLIHDTSSSGSTLFVEPMVVVELNNQIKELEAAQQNEIHRILLEFSEKVARSGDILLTNYETILDLDIIFAKSRLADQMMAGVPSFVEKGETNLIKARHPLISKDIIVPIDIKIGGDFDTLVVTGPNTGGKTVAIKTLGLFTLMAMCGFMLPCGSGSTVCYYSKVLADIGDEQSIEQSLSTFSSHMTNIISILAIAGSDSLVLIDELGAGTDPVEGAALAVAIIEQLRQQGARIAATTHYAEIKMYALETVGVENASCEFDVTTLKPTYRLLIGTLGKSNAFAISEKLGLPKNIITVAENYVSGENKRFEDVVSSLEEARQELEKQQEEAAQLRTQAERAKQSSEQKRKNVEKQVSDELEKAKQRAQGVVAQANFQYDELMKEIDKLKKQASKEGYSASLAQNRGQLKKGLAALEDTANPNMPTHSDGYKLPRPLKKGDYVFISDFGIEGTVLSSPDNKGMVRVKAGIMESKISLKSLRLVERDEPKVTFNGGAVNTRKAIKSAKDSATTELDIRGLDSGEAFIEMQRFIDNAVISNMAYATIIHGKGTGVLRKAVQDYLRSHPSVKSFRLGEYGEGGSGITVAELK